MMNSNSRKMILPGLAVSLALLGLLTNPVAGVTGEYKPGDRVKISGLKDTPKNKGLFGKIVTGTIHSRYTGNVKEGGVAWCVKVDGKKGWNPKDHAFYQERFELIEPASPSGGQGTDSPPDRVEDPGLPPSSPSPKRRERVSTPIKETRIRIPKTPGNQRSRDAPPSRGQGMGSPPIRPPPSRLSESRLLPKFGSSSKAQTLDAIPVRQTGKPSGVKRRHCGNPMYIIHKDDPRYNDFKVHPKIPPQPAQASYARRRRRLMDRLHISERTVRALRRRLLHSERRRRAW